MYKRLLSSHVPKPIAYMIVIPCTHIVYMITKPMIRYQHKDANKEFQRSVQGARFEPQLCLKKALAPRDTSFQVHHLTIPEALDLRLSAPRTKART